MKRIILSKITKGLVKESREDLFKLPPHIEKSLRKNKTSLGKHPSFPPEEEYSFDKKITLKRFDEIKDSIKDIDDITDFSEEGITTLLSKLIKECQEKEKPIRENLEKICFNVMVELFNIPNDILIYSCKLTDKIDSKNHTLRLTPENIEDVEFSDITELENISDEVYKRRLINTLIMGASMTYSSLMAKSYIGDIFELNSKLPELYSKIIKLNNLLMFIKNDIKISDENPMQGGVVNVTLGNESTKSKIDVEAMVFPILLSESIKGFMELFAAHGLPKTKEMALYVIKKADFLLAEPWDMRLGPILWKYVMDAMGDVDSKILPNIFNIIVELPSDKFFLLMKEIFARTKKGKDIMSLIVEKVKHDNEYNDFEKSLDTKRSEISVIEDDYIQADELTPTFMNEGRHKNYGGLDYLKKHTVPLTDDEKEYFKKNKVTWNRKENGEIVVKKAKAKDEKDGEVYFAYTHRAWGVKPTKKEAVKMGKFIESTS